MRWYDPSLLRKETEKYYIDSTKLAVCHNSRIYKHKTFKI
ncbi:transposase [Orientia tsutsugamushi]